MAGSSEMFVSVARVGSLGPVIAVRPPRRCPSRECAKRIEALRPEARVELEPVLGVPERGRAEPAHPFSAPRFACHEAGTFEYAEVFRRPCERQGKRPGEIADGRSPRGETTEDSAASGIEERVEDAVQIMFNPVVESSGVLAFI